MENKILLVDDEKDIADLIEEVLRQDNFVNIRKAYTGGEAVQICREYQPDVIILDIMLPDIEGIEVCRQIREFCSSAWTIQPSYFLTQNFSQGLFKI